MYGGALGACTRTDSTFPAVSGAITETCSAHLPTPCRMRCNYLNLYVLGFTVFVMTSLGLNGFITAQGRSSVAMKPLSSVVLNTALDPLFIFVLKMGVRGAAVRQLSRRRCLRHGFCGF